jgi:glycosyltransferase involved in cell wall biosynthesis
VDSGSFRIVYLYLGVLRLVGIDGKWAVPYRKLASMLGHHRYRLICMYFQTAHPQVFNITKNFHNILQGVAEPDKDLEPNHKKYFESWIETNYNKFWLPHGDELFGDRIIVIDDPQLTALIPLIKRKRPDCKIIFRSHIQIQSHLTDKPDTPQAHVWDYIFGFVEQTDLFIAHPVEAFVPRNVKERLPVLYMPPSTDPLDGLNKPLGREAIHHLREAYNRISQQQCQVTVDWKRGYIIQVARFDPSKGIPDLLAAYLDFRQRLQNKGSSMDKSDTKPPMLIIVGHGSVSLLVLLIARSC